MSTYIIIADQSKQRFVFEDSFPHRVAGANELIVFYYHLSAFIIFSFFHIFGSPKRISFRIGVFIASDNAAHILQHGGMSCEFCLSHLWGTERISFSTEEIMRIPTPCLGQGGGIRMTVMRILRQGVGFCKQLTVFRPCPRRVFFFSSACHKAALVF